jgi:small subunit ribosomal protein S5
MEEKFEFQVIEVKRVAKAVEGGKRIKVRAVVVAGNLNGKVGVGIGKGNDFSDAVQKARRLAEKNAINVPIVDGTIPYEFKGKFGATEILLRPAKKGRGLVAGSTVRTILSLAGYTDISSKILGVTKNPLVNALATIKVLDKLSESYQQKINIKSKSKNASSSNKIQVEEK